MSVDVTVEFDPSAFAEEILRPLREVSSGTLLVAVGRLQGAIRDSLREIQSGASFSIREEARFRWAGNLRARRADVLRAVLDRGGQPIVAAETSAALTATSAAAMAFL